MVKIIIGLLIYIVKSMSFFRTKYEYRMRFKHHSKTTYLKHTSPFSLIFGCQIFVSHETCGG